MPRRNEHTGMKLVTDTWIEASIFQAAPEEPGSGVRYLRIEVYPCDLGRARAQLREWVRQLEQAIQELEGGEDR